MVNRVCHDDVLVQEATDFARQLKALLRSWAVGGVAAADEAMFNIAMPRKPESRDPSWISRADRPETFRCIVTACVPLGGISFAMT